MAMVLVEVMYSQKYDHQWCTVSRSDVLTKTRSPMVLVEVMYSQKHDHQWCFPAEAALSFP